MTEELYLPSPYKVFLDLDSNTYYFQTETGAHYEILFTDAKGIFSSTALEESEVSNIVINKVKSGTGKRDCNIALTIEAILDYFFKDNERILIYQCNNMDGKHILRNRLFNTWFQKSYIKGTISKLDYVFEGQDPVYYTSLMYHNQNSIGEATITSTFQDITYILSSEK